MQAGEPATLRLAHPRGLRLALRRHGGGAAARRGRGDRRAHQPRRVRDGLLDRELVRGPDAESVGPRALAGRLVRRLGGGGRRRASCRPRSAATPAARSASPRRCAAWSGMKPTYGRVSRYGLVAFASSLDQIGPFAHTAADCALLLEAIAGHDPRDSTSLPEPAPRLAAALSGDVSGLTLGFLREADDASGVEPGVRARVREAVAELERAGAKLREVSLPHTRYAIATYYLIATAEASSNLARYDGVRYGHRAEAPRRHHRAVRAHARRGLRRRGEAPHPARHLRALGRLLRRLLPEGAAGAHAAAARLRRPPSRAATRSCCRPRPSRPSGSARSRATRSRCTSRDIFTVSANLAGLPGLSIPCGLDAGLPVGFQLLGRPREDATVLRIADAYQRRTDHHRARPPR